MIIREASAIIIIIVFTLIMGYTALKSIKPELMEDDNPMEEFLEDVWKDQTGKHIDLTPKSPEVKTSKK